MAIRSSSRSSRSAQPVTRAINHAFTAQPSAMAPDSASPNRALRPLKRFTARSNGGFCPIWQSHLRAGVSAVNRRARPGYSEHLGGHTKLGPGGESHRQETRLELEYCD